MLPSIIPVGHEKLELCKLVRGVRQELVPCWVWQDDPVTDPAIPRSRFSRQRLVTDLHPLA